MTIFDECGARNNDAVAWRTTSAQCCEGAVVDQVLRLQR